MARSTKGYIPRNNVSIEEIIKVLNSDGGTLKADNLDIREIFDQLETRKGNLYGKFVNGDGKPNTAPATRDIATDYTSIDPQVPGDTDEAKLSNVKDTGSYDLGDLRGYGGQEGDTSELPEIYWKSALDHKGYEKLPQTQEEFDSLKTNNAYPGIVLALPYSEDDISKYIDDNNTENYFSINQSVLFADKDKADIEKYFRLNTKVGVDYNNGGPTEEDPVFNIKVTPYLGIDFPTFGSETNTLFSFAGVDIVPWGPLLADAFSKMVFDYFKGPKDIVEVSSQLYVDLIDLGVFLLVVTTVMSVASAIWQFGYIAMNQPEIAQAPYQYRNLVGNLYNFLDIYESNYKFGFGNKNFGYDLESPTGADKTSFERYIRQTGEKFQYSLNDFNYSGIDYSETNLIDEFPANSPVRSKYLNMTFDPQGVQYDLQTPPPMISYLIELEAVQNCKLSKTKPTKFIVATTPYDYKYPYFDITTPMNPNTILDTDLNRIYSGDTVSGADRRDRSNTSHTDTTNEAPVVNPRRSRRPNTDSSNRSYRVYNNTPINFINGKWCDFIGLIDKEVPDEGGFTLFPWLFPERFRHIAINTDSHWERENGFYFGNNKYITPTQNNINSQGAEVFGLSDINGNSMIAPRYEDDYSVHFFNEGTPQMVSNYNFRIGNTDEILYKNLKPYWKTVNWDITQGAAFCNNASYLNTIYQELPLLKSGIRDYLLDIDVNITSGKLAFITGSTWNDNLFSWYRTGPWIGTGGEGGNNRPYFLEGELPEGISYGTGHGILIESSGKYRLCVRTKSDKPYNRIEFQASEGFTGKINSVKLTLIGKDSFTNSPKRGCYAINQINGRNKNWNITYINYQSSDYNFEFNVHNRYEPISLDVTVHDNFKINNLAPNSTKVKVIWGYFDSQEGTQTVTEDYNVTTPGEIINIYSDGWNSTLPSPRPDLNMSVTFEADFGEFGIVKAYSMEKLECHDSNLRIVKDRYGSLYGADVDLSNSGVLYKFVDLPFVINSLDISNTDSLDDTMALVLNGSIENSINISNTKIYGAFDNIINIPTIVCTDCDVSTYRRFNKPEGSFTYNITWKNCEISVESLNSLLIELDLSGATDGTLDIAGDNPEITNTYALEAIDSLISKGWNVTYNELTIPVITLVGDNPLTWALGETFVDPGATAYDERDGDITESIVVTDNIDVNTEGTYQVTYNVTDSDGNSAEEVVRTVVVEEVKTIWGTEIVEVTNPITGRTWMDRNIGATRAATSPTDEEAYGHLFQWGRDPDGHEVITSGTTSTLSSTDVPGHSDFIISNNDWRSPQNDNLWQGIIADGWRLPTEAEWEEERFSWSSANSAGAFGSVLKLPVAGNRYRSNGSLYNVGSSGYYWSSTVDGTYSRNLYFFSSSASMSSSRRAYGLSVRLIKDE